MDILIIIIALIGLLTYVLSSNAKLQEIGRLAFACALLALLFGAAPHVPRIR